MNNYTLLDSGHGFKLEQFGDIILSRPSAQAVWKPQHPQLWKQAHATFTREQGNEWNIQKKIPEIWHIEVEGIRFKLSTTDFGHLGIFPEQKEIWRWLSTQCSLNKQLNVLNLFAYSGGSTFACAYQGAQVCHLDASKGMVAWARENASLNQLQNAPIRWIVEDVKKFLQRELKRNHKYDGIILDPPTFGRGTTGEIFKLEHEFPLLLESCVQLLSTQPRFILLSCHTPGYTPIVLTQLLKQALAGYRIEIEAGEMVLSGSINNFTIPSGSYARCTFV